MIDAVLFSFFFFFFGISNDPWMPSIRILCSRRKHAFTQSNNKNRLIKIWRFINHLDKFNLNTLLKYQLKSDSPYFGWHDSREFKSELLIVYWHVIIWHHQIFTSDNVSLAHISLVRHYGLFKTLSMISNFFKD